MLRSNHSHIIQVNGSWKKENEKAGIGCAMSTDLDEEGLSHLAQSALHAESLVYMRSDGLSVCNNGNPKSTDNF